MSLVENLSYFFSRVKLYLLLQNRHEKKYSTNFTNSFLSHLLQQALNKTLFSIQKVVKTTFSIQ